MRGDLGFRAMVAGLFAAAVAAPALERPSYWGDEAASITMAQRPFADFVATIRVVDVVHAGYYTLLRFWTDLFGISEIGTRSLSLLAFGIAAAGLYVLSCRLTGSGFGPVLVFALLPGNVWIATEARDWAVASALVTWAMVALHRHLTEGRRRDLVWFAVAMIAGTYLSLYVLLLAPMTLWWAWTERRWRPTVVAWVAIVAATAPLVVAASQQRGQLFFNQLGAADATWRLLRSVLFVGQNPSAWPQWTVTITWVLLVTCTALAAVAVARQRRAALIGLFWWAVPAALMTLSTVFSPGLFSGRYIAYAAPGACLVIGIGLASLGRAWRWAAIVAMLIGSVPAHVAMTAENAKSDHDLRALAAVARGADEVVNGLTTQPVSVAYPNDFAGVRDLRAIDPDAPLKTLWQPMWPAAQVDSEASGQVVVYVRMYFGHPIAEDDQTLRRLRDRGCHQVQPPLTTFFARAVRLQCP